VGFLVGFIVVFKWAFSKKTWVFFFGSFFTTTLATLIEICNNLLLCKNFNDALTDLSFSILSLVNLLFYT